MGSDKLFRQGCTRFQCLIWLRGRVHISVNVLRRVAAKLAVHSAINVIIWPFSILSRIPIVGVGYCINEAHVLGNKSIAYILALLCAVLFWCLTNANLKIVNLTYCFWFMHACTFKRNNRNQFYLSIISSHFAWFNSIKSQCFNLFIFNLNSVSFYSFVFVQFIDKFKFNWE